MRKHQKINPYQLCACGSGKKIKWCHPKGFYPVGSYPEVEADLELGEALVKEENEGRNMEDTILKELEKRMLSAKEQMEKLNHTPGAGISEDVYREAKRDYERYKQDLEFGEKLIKEKDGEKHEIF